MEIWPSETVYLTQAGASLLPATVGFIMAEGLALRHRYYRLAKCWACLAGVCILGLLLCLLAGAFIWIGFGNIFGT